MEAAETDEEEEGGEETGAEPTGTSGPQLSPRRAEESEPAKTVAEQLQSAEAEHIPRAGAQMVDTLRINTEAADVLRHAYTLAGGERVGAFDGAAMSAADATTTLKGLSHLAGSRALPREARVAAIRMYGEMRKATSGGRGVAIASPEAEAHEHLHFAVNEFQFDAERILEHRPTRVAVMEARSRGLAKGSDTRVIREVITRIANGENDTVKLDRQTGRTILSHFLANSAHNEEGIGRLKDLAHEHFKDTIEAATGLGSGGAGEEGEEPGPLAHHRARPGGGRGDAGLGPHDGREGSEGPELSVRNPLAGDGLPDNYSGLGALQDKFVRNLSQLEKASPRAHAEAVRAAASNAQAATILRASVPRIQAALREGHGPSFQEFRQTLIEGRLQGIRERWKQLAKEARTRHGKGMHRVLGKVYIPLLKNVEGKRGFPQDLEQTAAALLARRKYRTLRRFLAQTFEDAAGYVAGVMPSVQFDANVQNPGFQEALRIYKETVAKPMAESHARNEGVFSTALGPLNAYYPLIPLDDQGNTNIAHAPGRRLPYRKPKNLNNAFATGMAEHGYSDAMEDFREKLEASVRANNKAALIQALRDVGLSKKLKRSETDDLFTYRGVDYGGVRVETKPDRQIIVNGKSIFRPASFDLIAAWLERELRPILEKPCLERTSIEKILSAINTFALAGPADFVFHTSNLMGTLVSNTPFLGPRLRDKAVSVPFAKRFAALGKVIFTDATSEESTKDLLEMAKLGLVPDRYGTVTYSRRGGDGREESDVLLLATAFRAEGPGHPGPPRHVPAGAGDQPWRDGAGAVPLRESVGQLHLRAAVEHRAIGEGFRVLAVFHCRLDHGAQRGERLDRHGADAEIRLGPACLAADDRRRDRRGHGVGDCLLRLHREVAMGRRSSQADADSRESGGPLFGGGPDAVGRRTHQRLHQFELLQSAGHSRRPGAGFGQRLRHAARWRIAGPDARCGPEGHD